MHSTHRSHECITPSLPSLPGHLVEDEEQEVEPRQQRVRKVDVLAHGSPLVVPPVERVGRREHRRASIEGGRDPGFGNANSLLLHHLYLRTNNAPPPKPAPRDMTVQDVKRAIPGTYPPARPTGCDGRRCKTLDPQYIYLLRYTQKTLHR